MLQIGIKKSIKQHCSSNTTRCWNMLRLYGLHWTKAKGHSYLFSYFPTLFGSEILTSDIHWSFTSLLRSSSARVMLILLSKSAPMFIASNEDTVPSVDVTIASIYVVKIQPFNMQHLLTIELLVFVVLHSYDNKQEVCCTLPLS